MHVSVLEKELAQLIVTELSLDGVNPNEIDPQSALFGEGEGLGLDSIDALELALAIAREYGCQLRTDDDEYTHIFASISSLSQYIEAQRSH